MSSTTFNYLDLLKSCMSGLLKFCTSVGFASRRDRRPACAEVHRGRCRSYSRRFLCGDSSAVLHFTPALPPAAEGTFGPASTGAEVAAAPWEGLPAVHPLVPLHALSSVKDGQQICVAVSVVENPGAVERHPKHGPAMVCNAIVQQDATRVRCSFWHEQAQELAEQQAGTCLMLYQVLISKCKDENSWEIGSWRGTTILPCSPEMAAVLCLSRSLCVSFGRLIFRFSFLFWFCLLWLILSGCRERRAGTQRQLPHVDGDSCEGLDRLPCHAIVAEHFGGSYSTRTVAEVGDGL